MPRIANTIEAAIAQLVAQARAEGRDQARAEFLSVLGGGSATRAKPKAKAKAKAKSAGKPARRKSGKPRKNPWAKYTDSEKLARINKMRKGRGLPAKKSL